VAAVAVVELDGRPVVISGSRDRTVRVWDLATGTPVGDPFTGHTGSVAAVAAAELDGRPVVISGSGDRTVRVWDLATRASAARIPDSLPGGVNSIILAASSLFRTRSDISQAHMVICAADRAIFLKACASTQPVAWKQSAAIQLGGQILSAVWHYPNILILGTEAGIAVLRVPQA
jgi:WD40 repeat protein